jgi:hypothetical protein
MPWHFLGVLREETEIIFQLARRLQRTQWINWKGALEPLLRVTADAHVSLETLDLSGRGRP